MDNKDNDKFLVLNTGGTFNKIYNDITGELVVSKNNNFMIKSILKFSKIDRVTIKSIIHKDSLDMNKKDRKKIIKYIERSKSQYIIIIHGTDTMEKTAKFINKHIKNKVIILTGAMVPYSIDKVEATANFSLAMGFLQGKKIKNDVYIAMHGKVKKYNKIYKNRELGIFECH